MPPNPSRRTFTLQTVALTGTTLVGAACGITTGGKGETPHTPDTSNPSDTGSPAAEWATGGTASMTGTYDEPFTTSAGPTCDLTCAMTTGPCYAETQERRDISEGVDGLPVRLALRVVDDACVPVVGAVVDVWHTAPDGLYSGRDAEDLCTAGNAKALAGHWFRGVAKTDSSGRVDFDTCFPGWYNTRAVHIHFQVRKPTEYVTAQLFFDQALIDSICTTEPIYKVRGVPRTANADDNVLGDSDAAMYTLDVARLPDGAMMASKTIVIRSSLAGALCGSGGSGGGVGP